MAKRLSAREAKYFDNLRDLHPMAAGLAMDCRLHRHMLLVLNDAVKAFVETNDRIRLQQKGVLEGLREAAEEFDGNVKSLVDEFDRVAAELKVARDAIDTSALEEAAADYIATEDRVAAQATEVRDLVLSEFSLSKLLRQAADSLEFAEDRRKEQCKSLLLDPFQEFVDEMSLGAFLNEVQECLDRIEVES